MNFLIYIESLTFHNQVTFFADWLNYIKIIPYHCLSDKNFQENNDFRILTNIFLADYCIQQLGVSDDKIVTLNASDITECFPGRYLKILRKFHYESYNRDALKKLGERVSDKMHNYQPDVILTFTPSPFLEHIYPHALIFHCDMSAFENTPFQLSFSFDPFGLYENSFPIKFAKELSEVKCQNTEIACLKNVRKSLDDNISKTFNAAPYVDAVREYFKRVILLPLQHKGDMTFSLHAPYANQCEYIFDVMSRIPQDTAVIVVEDPKSFAVGDYLNAETVNALRQAFPNFILFDAFRKIQNPGQFFMPFVDGLVTVSSPLMWLALLWKKPIISIEGSPFQSYALSSSLDTLNYFDDYEHQDGADHALAYLISRYWRNMGFYLKDPAELDCFFLSSLERFYMNNINFHFYDKWTFSENIQAHYNHFDQKDFVHMIPNFPQNAMVDEDQNQKISQTVPASS